MKFRTEVDIQKAPWSIRCNDKIALLGSCFSNNMARKLGEYYFQVQCNPTGTLYNPISIAHHVEEVIPNNDVIIITFGTAWVYIDQYPKTLSHKRNWIDNVVDNCQKRPASEFIRRRLTIEEIVEIWRPILTQYSDKQFIFTVSPIRHIKDGLHENNLSKAILLMAIERLIESSANTLSYYFPAYEIVLDELRDYRFYTEDMMHPSDVAVEYIWELFQKVFISPDTLKEMAKLHGLWLARNHRSLYPGSAEDKLFKKRIEEQLKDLQSRYTWLI